MYTTAESEIRHSIAIASCHTFPGKSVEEVIHILKDIGFSMEDAVNDRMTSSDIEKEVNFAYLVNNEYHPENPCDPNYRFNGCSEDPKDDFGFWRTGIRVHS